jgi:hypothetical protein
MFTSTSIRFGLHPKSLICPFAVGFTPTVIVFAGFDASWKITLVTPNVVGTPPTLVVKQKHAPVTNKSLRPAHCAFDGVTLKTTGALVPSATAHVVVLVNGPNTLLSPAPNVVVTVITPGPPQQADGNPVPGMLANTGIVAVTRLQLTGVTFTNDTNDSAIPSPFVSQLSVAAVDTVLPGRCSGTPVSASKPWQMVVTSFGKNPHPTMFNGTWQIAFTSPVAFGVVTIVPGTTFWH